MDQDSLHDFTKDASILAFNIVYQAIIDAFELPTIQTWGGGNLKANSPKMKQMLRNCRQDAVRFLFSDEIEDICKLASLHHYIPSPASIQRKYKEFKSNNVKLDMKELIKIAQGKASKDRTDGVSDLDYDEIEVNLNSLKRQEGRKMF